MAIFLSQLYLCLFLANASLRVHQSPTRISPLPTHCMPSPTIPASSSPYHSVVPPSTMHPGVLHRRFLNDLSTSLFSFVLPLLPTNEELTVKEECVSSTSPSTRS